ncbi:hypothetical protein [Actinokineospora sp. NPDC004072]
MSSIDVGRGVANPRRTRLGPDWTPGSSAGPSEPTGGVVPDKSESSAP